MAKTIIHPNNHLSLALAQVMKAAETPRRLVLFLTEILNHLHESRCPTASPQEEDEVGLITRKNDHVYSILLMLQTVAFPWAVSGGTTPTAEMIEGIEEMLGHFAAEGWMEMANTFTIALSRDFKQGTSDIAYFIDNMRIQAAFCTCVGQLQLYEEQKENLSKAA